VAVLARSFSIVGWWLEVGDAKPRLVIRRT
jgi:hypothetical protein